MQIQIENISKRFGRKKVISDISMTADGGECIGILGANGSGKSTLLSILAGVQRADGGRFLCDGTDLFEDTRKRSATVGYVPQGTPLIEELTAKDNLMLWYDRKALDAELNGGVLDMLGVGDFLKVPVSKMSGGMKKRLSIGCAMAHKPPVMLLDEPTAALDLACKESISAYLESYKAVGGIILLSTHDAAELALCNRWYIIKNGTLVPFEYDGDVSRLVAEL